MSEEHYIKGFGTPLEEAQAEGVEAARRQHAENEALWDNRWADFLGEVWKLAQRLDMAPRVDNRGSRAIFFRRLAQAVLDWFMDTDHHQH